MSYRSRELPFCKHVHDLPCLLTLFSIIIVIILYSDKLLQLIRGYVGHDSCYSHSETEDWQWSHGY